MQSNIVSKAGFSFSFDSLACFTCEGNCCIGESGYIWVNPKEIEDIANFLNLDSVDFKKERLRKVRFKYSLKEIKIDEKNYICEFFDLTLKKCLIYEVRPNQCRTFPFWDHFINNTKEVKKECPGIVS